MEVFRQLAAVGLVLGLLALLMWTLRRRGLAVGNGFRRGRKSPGRLETIERLALSPQHTLHLVRVADHALLIEVHPGGSTLLENLPLASVAERSGMEGR
jgi:flagellar biogenesis protein FliO